MARAPDACDRPSLGARVHRVRITSPRVRMRSRAPRAHAHEGLRNRLLCRRNRVLRPGATPPEL